MPEEKVLFTVPEVRELTGLGRSTLYRVFRTGELPVVRVERAVRVGRSSLDRAAILIITGQSYRLAGREANGPGAAEAAETTAPPEPPRRRAASH
jgi:excisionase family DNA binding protein